MEKEHIHSSIFIDLTPYINANSPTVRVNLAGGIEQTDSPPVRSSKRIKLLYADKTDQTKMQVKFRPKVMVDGPITPSPSCRRVLDFGSDSRIQTKSMLIYTKGGDCFTRQAVSVICNEKEEEEKWKKEQELFKERVLSYITSMRLVQGNRPFMGWKGSVVDSVVGVFLTQNAADNSSSSAFMSLAAKYPKKISHQNENDHNEHALDWDAVRNAQPAEISQAIYERGMNNKIAERIQKFLDRIHDEKSGLFDLEWLRDAKPKEAMKFFMEVYGLGLKSMECLRLLTLRQQAFPVDRHVSRIVVRLGWVPVEKLPDGVLMHQLEEYPVINRVQEYLSERLSNLDVETLYELHYQMITFGKVFCTKKKPNCNSCPLKNECMHFASAATTSDMGIPGEATFTSGGSKDPTLSIPYQELEDIEDLCLSPRSHELKVATRLRTKHRVYELYDSHPLVQELDKRDPNDTNPYLLVIWPPEECYLLKSSDSQEDTVFGTLLVPCRTATRGSFPLDGTFFQINEVFADDESSEKPLEVPTKLLLDLTTKTLYCGTSISSIFEGYICIRGFSMKTRAPRPLHEQFHRPLTKTIKINIKGKSPRKRTKNNRTNM
ncbi:hypothetical protein E3N88_37147 [Mikania micrantha]|uniref:HhH-GPD domain-containing protein n=1 Tax=Mikania micrantha TaxID=192012 RepID=A0A5N6M5Y0_9ASTR|nr:hypothetical protein E3N88_37147 [Mikania micrantha]